MAKRLSVSNQLSPEAKERLKLRYRWFRATGEEIPGVIADLPLDCLLRAVQLRERGDTVFVPQPAIQREPESGSSLREWDDHGNGFT